ncbi:MAG: diguanylate cyclase [Deltaproteobacteria bacterium]|nr:diguanylate cyclase [Deltaproteobacteria bacterium]
MTQQESTLLLVTDDANLRDCIVRSCASLTSLVTCLSTEDAFAQLGQVPVSIVLLDSELGGIAPWQFAERLRRIHPAVELALLVGDDYGAEDDDLRDGWLIGVVSRSSPLRAMRGAIRRLLRNFEQSLEIGKLKNSLEVLEQCRRLISCLEPGRVYPVALDITLELLSRSRGGAVFQRESVPMSDAVAFRGLAEGEAQRLRELMLDEKPLSEHAGEVIEVVDSGPYLAALHRAGVAAERVLLIPIQGQDFESGMLWLLEDGRPFEEQEIERARVVASYAMTALVNCERYHHAKERAFIDDVTEVYNARYLLATTENEIRRAERYDNPLSVLFLDIDRFKLVNDRHGHLVGSQVLRSLSKLLMQCVRDVDTLARYGGDEFTILLVDTDHTEAVSIAERIRRTVEEHVFEAGRGGSLRLTVSLGVGTYPHHGSERNALLDVADKAMYRAKSLGRNQVCSANELTS